MDLLALGLILLSGGLWANARARRELSVRRARLLAHGPVASAGGTTFSPIVLVAWLLLTVALTTLAVILSRYIG